MGLVRLILVGFGVYVVLTASVEDQARMYSGVRAFIQSAVAACTDAGRPCTVVVTRLGTIRFAQQHEPAKHAQVAPVDTSRQASGFKGF